VRGHEIEPRHPQGIAARVAYRDRGERPRKPLTQSELAAQQKRILQELRKHTAPGTRTDLKVADTCAKDFAQVERATRLVGQLYGESDRQVEKRLAVVAAAENAPDKDRERFGKLVAYMDRSGRVHQAYAELRRIQVEEAEALPAEAKAEVIAGDFRIEGPAVAGNSVDLVFTDSLYARKFVPLFGDLAAFASRVLVPGGSLITYVGHHTLPEVLPLMTPQHLRYHWSCAAVASEPRRRIVPPLGVATEHHLLLWFTKGKRRTKTVVVDTVKSARGPKITEHEMAQGGPVASYYIERLSRKGSLVCDPFLGSGTTAIAALKAGRSFVGFEIDPETARKAEPRINRVQRVGTAS
jgi:SAM-dependent methyltransferase